MRPKSSIEAGLATVEFAIAGTVFFLVVFGVVEIGRVVFARTELEDAARRGARLAAVCPVNDAAISTRAVNGGSNTPILPGLLPANVQITYLDAAGAVIANPAAAANYGQINFVRATIQNYSTPLAIPGLNLVFSPNGISATLPRESLGVSTVVSAC